MTMTSPRPMATSSYFHPAHPAAPSTRPLGLVADQSPAGGTKLKRGSTVTIQVV